MRLVVFLLVSLASSGCLQGAAPGSATQDSPGPTDSPASTSEAPPPSTSASASGTTTAPDAAPTPPAWSPGPWTEVPCPAVAESGAEAPMPDLLARTGGGDLLVLSWNGTQYAVQAQAAVGRTLTAVLHAPGGASRIYTASATNATPPVSDLRAYDRDLRPVASLGVPAVGALAARDGILWVATKWNLTAYTPGLQEVSRVAIPVPSGGPAIMGKALDGLMVEDGTAYVVDDVVFPFYVFRVDVRDPARLAYLDRHDLAGSAGPKWQWLDAAGRTWFVEERFAGMGGGSVGTAAIDTASGARGTGPQLSSSQVAYTPRPYASGHAILASGPRLPAWTVGLGNGTTWLGRMDFAGTAVHLACKTALPGADHAALAVDAGRIFTATPGRLQVHAWQAGMPLLLDQAVPGDLVELHAL